MEEILNKIVNLAIGAVKNADEGLKDAASKVETEINELIAKGEAAQDERSTQVKKFVEDALVSLNDVQSQVQNRTEEAYASIKPSIDKAVEFVSNLRDQVQGNDGDAGASSAGTAQA